MEIDSAQLKTQEDVERLVQPKPASNEPNIWIVLLFCLLIPPLGLLYAWWKKVLYRVLPSYVSITSLLFILSLFNLSTGTNPLNMLVDSLDLSSSYPSYSYLYYIGYGTGIVGITVGIFSEYKLHSAIKPNKRLTIFLFAVYLLEVGILLFIQFLSVLQVYTLTSEF